MAYAGPVTPPGQAGSRSTNVWSPGTPRTPSQVARVRYRENEYFKLWRSGRKDEWQGPQWKIALEDLPPRRPGAWDRRMSTPSAGVENRRQAAKNSIRYYPSGSGSAALSFIQEPTKKMLSTIRGASLLKILGYGGQGVAALLEVTDRQGPSKKAVMKMCTEDDEWAIEDLKTEKKWQVSLMRAMHAVQLIKWATLRGTPLAPEDVELDNNPRLYFMELMKNGDLHQVIGRAGNIGQKLPSRLLWKIFACLIRGCIAMKYPPRLQSIVSGTNENWLPEVGPNIREEVPAGLGMRTARDYDLVHFDLDPKNIFIGDFDGEGHGYVPRFKIADLGLADRTTEELLTTSNNTIKSGNGLENYRASSNPHYKWRPITDPGVTFGPFNSHGLPQQYASVETVRDHNGEAVSPFHTNGAGLVGEEGLDPRLRNLLMRCLALIPAHRPGLIELEAWASDAETNPGFFSGIGGNLTSTELADQFICRPRSPPPAKIQVSKSGDTSMKM
ncbi:hypothetical protein INS49_013323 [Diaporthe citri]|uniref:uncharacterized protein n=1 Tax=Diaporthe citri TaxID=83186 RepID=UPI001C8225E2|nr:uncharacterized protein INS49_013323 [Diaporthe citri]KAG6357446.1 hypothetical protein INS49_013323 [Diaporthe citri]